MQELNEYGYIIGYNNGFPVWLDGTFYAKDTKEAVLLGLFLGLNNFEVCEKIEECR